MNNFLPTAALSVIVLAFSAILAVTSATSLTATQVTATPISTSSTVTSKSAVIKFAVTARNFLIEQKASNPYPVAQEIMEVSQLQGIWDWPLSEQPTVGRRFEPPEHRYGAGHRGVDLIPAGNASAATADPVSGNNASSASSNPGPKVLAVADGKVKFSGMVAGRPVISILHSNGLESTYEPVVALVSAGDKVQQNQVIGNISSEHLHFGCSSSCLHLGAKFQEDYLDPLLLINGFKPSVLLPAD